MDLDVTPLKEINNLKVSWKVIRLWRQTVFLKALETFSTEMVLMDEERLSEMCCGKSVIQNANKSQDADADADDHEDIEKIEWPVDSIEKAKTIRTKTQTMTGYLEAVAFSFVTDLEVNTEEEMITTGPTLLMTMNIVLLKLSRNPNSYACILGLSWALVSNRWDLKFPSIIEGSVLIMSNACPAISMFCIGLFMALQPKMIACGVKLTSLTMLLRFVVAPAVIAVGSLIMGLRGDILCIAIIQAAIPPSTVSFIFAKEYELHTNVLSTAVIFGNILSIPVLISYYVVLDAVNT